MENEPEEGEIIDNYEVISSDEELTMRQRIEELEAKNKELEQIAVISRSYSNKYHYPVKGVYNYHNNLHRNDYIQDIINYDKRLSHKTSGASLISSTDFITCEPSIKYRKRKMNKRKHLRSHHHGRRCKRRYNYNNTSKRDRGKEKHFAYMTNPVFYSDSSSNNSEEDESFVSEINRNALHLAIARHPNNSTCNTKQGDVGLRERLLKQIDRDCGRDKEATLNNFKEDTQLATQQDDNSSDSLEEKELRLIALKSAVLKKHVKRTKRDAESAYSPTDFDEMLNSGILNTYEVDSELELDLINSPIISPKLLLSPLSNLDEMSDDKQHSTSATVISQVDTKVVDMDISNSDGDDMACPTKWCDDFAQLTPPLSHPIITNVHPLQYNYSQSDNYSYVSNLHLQSLPPGVEYYENITPPCEIMASLPNVPKEDPSVQEMELEIPESESNIDHPVSPQPQSDSKYPDNSTYSCEEAEEEEALRTLLLAKMQSLRLKRRNSIHIEKKNQENREIVKKGKFKSNNTTEIILKEAVRRFRSRECGRVEQSHNKEMIGILHESNAMTTTKQIIDLTIDDHFERRSNDTNLDNIKSLVELPQHETDEVILNDCLELTKQRDIPTKNDSSNAQCNVLNLNSLSVIPEAVLNNVESLKENNFNTTFENDEKPIVDSECTTINNVTESEIIDEDKQLKSNITQTQSYNKLVEIVHEDNLESKDQTEKNPNVCVDDKVKRTTQNVETISELKTSKESFSKIETKSVELSTATTYFPKNSQSFQLNIASRKTIFDKLRVPHNRKLLMNAQSTTSGKVQKFVPYSIFRTQKIVKPNKVINKNIEISTNFKKDFKKVVKPPAVSFKTVKSNPKDLPDSSINLGEKNKVQVKRLVIDLHDISSDSFESLKDDISPIYETYNDNASPISLNMENSSQENPLRSDSPIQPCINTDKKTKHQHFEKKLETFLKSIRSKVNEDEDHTSAKDFTELQGVSISAASKNISTTVNYTPVAVRHLPVATQEEYRRLVHRMKMLENQRKLQKETNKKPDVNESVEISSTTINGKTINNNLCKSVHLKNTTKNTTELDQSVSNSPNNSLNNNELLSSYEKQLCKICTDIVNNLDKSLRLVADAKKYKVRKLTLQRQIKTLKDELNSAQCQYAAEQEKIQRILPIIGTSNEVILTLKKKHSQIIKMTVNLGKTLNGENYCLPNELNHNIAKKTEQLSKEIKVVNSLTANDITDDYTGVNGKQIEGAVDSIEIPNEYNFEKAKDKSHEGLALITTKVLGLESASNQVKVDGSSELQDNDEAHPLSEQRISTTDNKSNDHEKRATLLLTLKENDDGSIVNEYKSPLKHLRKLTKILDPHGILCPYNLMGDCEDTNCSYMHVMEQLLQQSSDQ